MPWRASSLDPVWRITTDAVEVWPWARSWRQPSMIAALELAVEDAVPLLAFGYGQHEVAAAG
jgi:hypothetical protein